MLLDDARSVIAAINLQDEAWPTQVSAKAEEDRQKLRRRRKALEDEWQKFTQAAKKLGQERAEFDKERLELQENRRPKEVSTIIIASDEKPQNSPTSKKVKAKARRKNHSGTPARSKAESPARACSADSRIALKASKATSISAALQNILAVGVDTPSTRPLLAAKAVNPQPTAQLQKKKELFTMDIVKPPSSAALAARDRVRRAVHAAQGRSAASLNS